MQVGARDLYWDHRGKHRVEMIVIINTYKICNVIN